MKPAVVGETFGKDIEVDGRTDKPKYMYASVV